MPLTFRFCLVVIAGTLVCSSPAVGGQHLRARVLGTVVQADRAHLARATVMAGTNVYSCEALETDEGGALRVQVGTSQIYLPALSATQLEQESSEIRALVMRGTLAFSSPASSNFALETPAGVLRADGAKSVVGQVVVTGPHEMLISAVHGDLLLDTWGEFRSIPEGKSARIEFGSTLEVTCIDKGGAGQANEVRRPLTNRKIGFYIITGAAVAVPSYFIWQSQTISPSTP